MSHARVLVIDDDANLREMINSYLSDEGYAVLESGSARGAKELVESSTIDLILLDVRLPDGDGFNLLREMRTMTSTPVIMLTGRDTPSAAGTASVASADGAVGEKLEAGSWCEQPAGAIAKGIASGINTRGGRQGCCGAANFLPP